MSTTYLQDLTMLLATTTNNYQKSVSDGFFVVVVVLRSDLLLSAIFHWPFSRDGQLVAIISYANDLSLSLSFSLLFFYSVVFL